jgi:hypothetical protein
MNVALKPLPAQTWSKMTRETPSIEESILSLFESLNFKMLMAAEIANTSIPSIVSA